MTERPDPGKTWMLAVKDGDAEAFRHLVDHYGGDVKAFFRRSGVEATAAEDLTQEVFLRVFRARDRYQPTARFTAWLHHIAHHLAINDGTRNRWRHARSLEPSVQERLEGQEGSGLGVAVEEPPQQLAREELRERVRRAMEDLPEHQRQALILHRFQGLSYVEVGEVLGLSVSAVKSLLFRARERLREQLAAWRNVECNDEA